MMNYLRKRRLRRSIGKLRREVARTDREQAPLAVARMCHDLAQLSIQEGRRRDAVRWFGQSIDAYIYAGFTGAAAAMCSKLIRFEPNVIRARATLAMLYLANGLKEEALAEIRGYVEATRLRGERAEITEERLRLLASLADDHEIRLFIGRSLLELGAAEGAHEVLGQVERERRGDSPSPLNDQERWTRLLEAALQAPAAVV
jgi:thioredoxin-like negative regulator of GroEL